LHGWVGTQQVSIETALVSPIRSSYIHKIPTVELFKQATAETRMGWWPVPSPGAPRRRTCGCLTSAPTIKADLSINL